MLLISEPSICRVCSRLHRPIVSFVSVLSISLFLLISLFCARSRAAADDLAWAASLQSAPWPLPPVRSRPPLKQQLLQLGGRLLRRAYRQPFLIA